MEVACYEATKARMCSERVLMILKDQKDLMDFCDVKSSIMSGEFFQSCAKQFRRKCNSFETQVGI